MSTDFHVKAEHPRLSLSQDQLDICLQHIAEDSHFAQCAGIVRSYAEAFLGIDPIQYELEGRRLLGPVRSSLRRIVFLAFAYRLWGERRYFDRCVEELEAACALKDWNPSHFLDTAEMATGLAYGYDWLFDELSDEFKQRIRQNLIEKAIEPSFGPNQHWLNSTNNWVQVCHGGLVLAALAIYEDAPDQFDRLYQRAVLLIPKAIEHSYSPDGAYPEGPGYWSYGTSFSTIMYDGLLSGIGPEAVRPLIDIPGFLTSAYYRIHMIGPDTSFYSYSDCGAGGKIGMSPSMWWCANQLQDEQLQGLIKNIDADALPRMLDHIDTGISTDEKHNKIDRLFPFLLLWSRPVGDSQSLDQGFVGRGPNPVCSMRSSWEDPNATWLAAKGGNLQVGHPQMDAGSFVFVSEGVRWVHDLGADGYHKLETNFGSGLLWATKPRRFEFMRLGLKAHSTLRINCAQQEIHDSLSEITHFNAREKTVQIDMSRAWRSQATSVRRGMRIIDDKHLLIQDEVVDPRGVIEWNLVTFDDLTIEGSQATINHDGKQCQLRILEPQHACFIKKSLKPDNEIEHQNEGFARLCIECIDQSGLNRIRVVMSCDQDYVMEYDALAEALSEWPTED